jgi:hypothetical protein
MWCCKLVASLQLVVLQLATALQLTTLQARGNVATLVVATRSADARLVGQADDYAALQRWRAALLKVFYLFLVRSFNGLFYT